VRAGRQPVKFNVLPSTLTEAPAYPKCGISRPGDVAPSRCTWVVVNVVGRLLAVGGPCDVSGASNTTHRLPTDLKRNRTVG
jgi:hypothetical protein